MGRIVVTIKVLPDSPNIDMDSLIKEVEKIIKDYNGEPGKYEVEPIAFGLRALYLYFLIEETGDTESIITETSKIKGIDSAEIIDIRKEFDLK